MILPYIDSKKAIIHSGTGTTKYKGARVTDIQRQI